LGHIGFLPQLHDADQRILWVAPRSRPASLTISCWRTTLHDKYPSDKVVILVDPRRMRLKASREFSGTRRRPVIEYKHRLIAKPFGSLAPHSSVCCSTFVGSEFRPHHKLRFSRPPHASGRARASTDVVCSVAILILELINCDRKKGAVQRTGRHDQ
jgi:hypothetical protein